MSVVLTFQDEIKGLAAGNQTNDELDEPVLPPELPTVEVEELTAKILSAADTTSQLQLLSISKFTEAIRNYASKENTSAIGNFIDDVSNRFKFYLIVFCPIV